MWLIVKAEFKYNQAVYLKFLIIFLLFSVAALNDFNLVDIETYGNSYWGAAIAGVFYMFYFMLWPVRLKELREKQNVLLPVSTKQIGIANIVYVLLPILAAAGYFLIFHVIIFSLWKAQSASIVLQLGIFYTVFTTLLLIREILYTIGHKSFSYKAAVILTLLIFVAGYLIITSFFFYEISTKFFGEYFVSLIYYLPVAINLAVINFLFQKRRTYLT